MELESFELSGAYGTTGSSHRRQVGRGMNEDQSVNQYVPASLNGTIFYATVYSRDQPPGLCTPAGSILDLRRPMKKFRRNQWLECVKLGLSLCQIRSIGNKYRLTVDVVGK